MNPQDLSSHSVAASPEHAAAQTTSTAAVMAMVNEYGNLMRDAGIDEGSDFADRRRDAESKFADAGDLVVAIAAAIAKLESEAA